MVGWSRKIRWGCAPELVLNFDRSHFCALLLLFILLFQIDNEVISNSMDAGATSVEIKLDLPRYRLSIADNGRGIPADKLQSLVATAQGVKTESTRLQEKSRRVTSTTAVRHRGAGRPYYVGWVL